MSVKQVIEAAQNGKHYIQSEPGKFSIGETVTCEIHPIHEATPNLKFRQRRKAIKNGEVKQIGTRHITIEITGLGQAFDIEGHPFQRYYGNVHTHES